LKFVSFYRGFEETLGDQLCLRNRSWNVIVILLNQIEIPSDGRRIANDR